MEFADGLLPEPLELAELREELVDFVFGALNGASQEQNHLHDFLVLGDHLVQTLFLVILGPVLVPVVEGLAAPQNCSAALLIAFWISSKEGFS